MKINEKRCLGSLEYTQTHYTHIHSIYYMIKSIKFIIIIEETATATTIDETVVFFIEQVILQHMETQEREREK